MHCVYKHTAPNGKVYIGITSQTTERRWRNGNGYRSCTYFYRAIQKYGWDNIKHEILLDGLSKEEACERERFYISIYDSANQNFGYNLDNGGSVGKKLSEEQIEKMKMFRHSPETIELLRKKSLEYFKTHDGTFKGRHHTEETKRKISEAHK